VLAVGDEGFTHKCLDKFGEFKRRGKTILLVTHSLGLVERFCDEAVWLDAGVKKAEGDPQRVIGSYVTDVARQEERFLVAGDEKARRGAEAAGRSDAAGPAAANVSDMNQASEGRWGAGGVEITSVTFQDATGAATQVFHTGETMRVVLGVKTTVPVRDFVFGIGVFLPDGLLVYGTNTDIEEMESDRLDGDAQVTLQIESLDLVEGTYKLDVAVHKRDGAPYDYHRLLHTFRVKSRIKDSGIYRVKHRWDFSPSVKFKAPK
jgi:ABC-type glutathione transport system ATPase component